MRILFALTYYRPHISGLTVYVERLAHELARRGHAITILTSQYDAVLPLREMRDGVRVVRVPVLARLSKGVLMPTIGWVASVLALHHDAMSLHLPQFDASGLALRGRLLRQPVVLTYQCDLHLPPGPFNRAASRAIHLSNHMAGHLAHVIVASTRDYADHSPYLSRFRDKVRVIPMPVEVAAVTAADVAAFRHRWKMHGPIIGIVARLAAEKGVEVVLQALPHILQAVPEARVCFVGPTAGVIGEEAYARRLAPLFHRYREHWVFLGTLSQTDLAAFYACCDVLALPSLNATESFGLVQVEAMLCGTPCVVSDLPGVRQPVRQTGMGLVVPVGDRVALAEAVVQVIRERDSFVRPRHEIVAHYSTERTASEYERLFQEVPHGPDSGPRC